MFGRVFLQCRSSQVWISSGQTWNFFKSSLIVLLLMCCIAQVRGWLSRGEWGMLGVQGCGVPAFSLVLPTDSGFGARLLELCNQGLFECLALNLHCLGGQQMELAAVINGRIVSTTQPQRPSLLFSWVSILWYPVVSFSSPHCHPLFFDTFQKLVEGFVFHVCFLPLSVACLVG